ncbi:YfhO family protein [Lachnobacterium bovis]|uniref:YfhO family protein n=1 Tax=Lachnobacterium bovis TaxID=140626 RepID=UPI0003B47DB5|nr:YfhO family protein [Lachnobacterium bovis]
MQKTTRLRAQKESLIAFFIPFIVCVAIIVFKKIYPFGNKCMLHIDMYHQYYPYFSEFREALVKNKSLHFSFNNGIGNDFFALYAYYLASPLNLFLVICPTKYIIEFMTILIVVKISLASLFAYKYFVYHFGIDENSKNLFDSEKCYAIALATSYALCGFCAAYSWNIMWLDSFALFPAVLCGIDKLVKENKAACYYVSLAIAIWANYYISIMICIFSFMYFIYIYIENAIEKKEKSIRSVINFIIFSLLSGSTSAVLILPELSVLKYAYSSTSTFPKKSTWYFGFLDEIMRMSLGIRVYIDDKHLPNIYTTTAALLLLVLYIFNKKIKLSRKIPRIIIVTFFFVSFSNNILDFIWHGLHFPSFLPARQSFIFSLIILCLMFEVLRNIEGIDVKRIIVALCIVFAPFLYQIFNGKENMNSNFNIIVTLLFVFLYAIILIILRRIKRCKKIFTALFAMIMISEVAINMTLVSFETTSRSSYLARSKDYKKIVEYLEKREGDNFYRVEQSERKTKNDAMLYNYSSATEFSSILNYNVSKFYQNLGLEGGTNFYSYYGATPVISAMLSVKYYISKNANEANGTRKFIKKIGDFYVYENTYTLPVGFAFSDEAEKNWNEKDLAPIDSINALSKSILLSESTELLTFSSNLQNVKPGKTTIKIYRPGHLYAVYDSIDIEYIDEYVNDDLRKTFSSISNDYILDLGEVKLGDRIYLKNDENRKIKFYIYNLNEKQIQENYKVLAHEKFKLESFEQTGLFNGVSLKGNIKLDKEKNIVFSIPYQKGWKCKVNGQEKKIESFKDTFIKIPLNKGENDINLEYETPYFKLGAFFTFASIISAILLISRRTNIN